MPLRPICSNVRVTSALSPRCTASSSREAAASSLLRTRPAVAIGATAERRSAISLVLTAITVPFVSTAVLRSVGENGARCHGVHDYSVLRSTADAATGEPADVTSRTPTATGRCGSRRRGPAGTGTALAAALTARELRSALSYADDTLAVRTYEDIQPILLEGLASLVGCDAVTLT